MHGATIKCTTLFNGAVCTIETDCYFLCPRADTSKNSF